MLTSSPPPIQQLGTAVLIQGSAVLDLYYLAALGVRECRRDGLMPVGRLKPVLDVLAATASTVRESGVGQVDAADPPDSSGSGVLDEIGTTEVAEVLGVSHRQAQRLTRRLGGRRVPGGALVVDRGAVDVHRLDRLAREESERP